LKLTVEDITPDKLSSDQRAKFLPYRDNPQEKGIVIFYVPFVRKDETRIIKRTHFIPEDFSETLLKGKPEKWQLSLQTNPINEMRIKTTIFRLLIDRDLGKLTVNKKTAGGTSFLDDDEEKKYIVYGWKLPELPFIEFEVEFRLGS
jgi:hypothetical protein